MEDINFQNPLLQFEFVTISKHSSNAQIKFSIVPDKKEFTASVLIEAEFTKTEDNVIVNDWRIFIISFYQKKSKECIAAKFIFENLCHCDLEEMIFNHINNC